MKELELCKIVHINYHKPPKNIFKTYVHLEIFILQQ